MPKISAITEHMKVRGSDGGLVGIVDHTDGRDSITLTGNDSPDGRSHVVAADLVARVDAEVHLSKPAGEVMKNWDPDGADTAAPGGPANAASPSGRG